MQYLYDLLSLFFNISKHNQVDFKYFDYFELN